MKKLFFVVLALLFLPNFALADKVRCVTSTINAEGIYPPDDGEDFSDANQKIMIEVQVSVGTLTAKVQGSLRKVGDDAGLQWKNLDTTTALTPSTGTDSNGSAFYPHIDLYTMYRYNVSACTSAEKICVGGSLDGLSCTGTDPPSTCTGGANNGTVCTADSECPDGVCTPHPECGDGFSCVDLPCTAKVRFCGLGQ